jgi:hypothetical protein
MAVVDHHEIALRIEPRPPQFTYAARARSEVRKRPLLWRTTGRNGVDYSRSPMSQCGQQQSFAKVGFRVRCR